MNDSEKLTEVFGEKWFITFNNPDGTKNGGLTSCPEVLIEIIKHALAMGSKNIVIKDGKEVTPWHIK